MAATLRPRAPAARAASASKGPRTAAAASGPEMTASARAAVATSRARTPTVSRAGLSGWTPFRLTRPRPGFRPTTPQVAAGIRTEPPVSLPSAASQRPAATATAEPEDEPPGARWTLLSQGFQGAPTARLVPQPP